MRRNYIFLIVGMILVVAVSGFFLLSNNEQPNKENTQTQEQNISNTEQTEDFIPPITNPNLNNFFLYVNNNEIDKLISLMTEETIITDQEREFKGKENITQWLNDEIIGATYTIINEYQADENQKYFKVEIDHPKTTSTILGYYDIRMDGDKITQAIMTYRTKRD